MLNNNRRKPKDKKRPLRCVHSDGVIEEWGLMGRTVTIPSSPRQPAGLLTGTVGWESLQSYMSRLRSRW
jgi:hypothetical protein